MNSPKVTIIIPVYNGSAYILKTLESCANQSYQFIEVIIIDDCSTDNSRVTIKNYIADNNRFILIENTINLGIARNINKGINLADGEFIIALGQDDTLSPNHISTMLHEIKDEDSLIYCNSNLIDGSDNVIGVQMDEHSNQINIDKRKYHFMLGNTINSCGLLFRKSAAAKVGGWTVLPETPHYGEWLFWMKLLTVGNIRYTTKIRSNYRRHYTNISNTFSDKNYQRKLFGFYLICMKFAYGKFSNEITFEEKIKAKISYLKIWLKQKLLLIGA